MTTEERISEWMQGREDELVEALVPLIAAESTRSDAKAREPLWRRPRSGPGAGNGTDKALGIPDGKS